MNGIQLTNTQPTDIANMIEQLKAMFERVISHKGATYIFHLGNVYKLGGFDVISLSKYCNTIELEPVSTFKIDESRSIDMQYSSAIAQLNPKQKIKSDLEAYSFSN